jgi:hypothetical protein
VNIQTLTDLFKLVLSVLASVTGLGSVLYFVLQKALEAHFASRLEQTKHELQLEQQKMSVVYEHQKDSFRKVLIAMDAAIKRIEDKVEGAGGEWGPISAEDHETFRTSIPPERLFLDPQADQALQIFAESMWGAVQDGYFEADADSDDVRRAYEEMKLISDRIAEHFRMRVGLVPNGLDPLVDVEILDACKLVTTWGKGEFEMFRPAGRRPEELVTTAKGNIESLVSALIQVRDRLTSSSERASFLFSTITRINRYVDSLAPIEGSRGAIVRPYTAATRRKATSSSA